MPDARPDTRIDPCAVSLTEGCWRLSHFLFLPVRFFQRRSSHDLELTLVDCTIACEEPFTFLERNSTGTLRYDFSKPFFAVFCTI
jgi:hypothetical protein